MSPFAFYTVITAHNLLIFAPNRLQNTQNSHQAHQATGLPGHRGSFWARLWACLPNADHCVGDPRMPHLGHCRKDLSAFSKSSQPAVSSIV
jgi:hypothetical protein